MSSRNPPTPLDDFQTSELMINISSGHLINLRTQCELDAELIQRQIRETETKLAKLFGKQVLARRKAESMQLKTPAINTRHWLKIVGLSEQSVEKLANEIDDCFDALVELPTVKLEQVLHSLKFTNEEKRKVLKSVEKLTAYIEVFDSNNSKLANELDLHWDSWDQSLEQHSQHQQDLQTTSTAELASSPFASTCDLNSSSSSPFLLQSSKNSKESISPSRCASPSSSHTSKQQLDLRPPQTSNKLYQSNQHHQPQTQSRSTSHQPDPSQLSLTKSKSHEEQLTNRADHGFDQYGPNGPKRERLATVPAVGHMSPLSICSPIRSPPGFEGSDSCFDEPGSTNSLGQQAQLPNPPNSNSTSNHPNTHNNSSSSTQSISSFPPRSPRTHGGMKHEIPHVFAKTVRPAGVLCILCEKRMIYGLKCQECKCYAHHNCSGRVPPNCGLPAELVSLFRETLRNREGGDPAQTAQTSNSTLTSTLNSTSTVGQTPGSPLADLLDPPDTPSQHTPHMLRKSRIRKPKVQAPAQCAPFGSTPDSSSATSSCNSSNASSPAAAAISGLSSGNTLSPAVANTFQFPDPVVSRSDYIEQPTPALGAAAGASAAQAQAAQTTIHPTTYPTSQPSQPTPQITKPVLTSALSSQADPNELESSLNSEEGVQSGRLAWPRQNSLNLREWEIPFHELTLSQEIGRGRYGTVYKGHWHGNVAIKLFNMTQTQSSIDFGGGVGGGGADAASGSALQAFRLEFATFRKTRHENVVLFMGACMKPPHLAIVTSFCRGHTLFAHIHSHKERFTLSRLVGIATQVAQGMGYLHAKGILHKDLKTSNIFYDTYNNKITITDFGLFSVGKLCDVNLNQDQLQVPKEWLCYLAPEQIRMLQPYDQNDLTFTAYTDVYSFGTIWHELCTGSFPFKSQLPELIIWQVSKGVKQPLRNLQASKEIKEILMMCWAYRPQERPDFAKLVDILKNLPKKRLQRSPSHPTHLLRSLESLF